MTTVNTIANAIAAVITAKKNLYGGDTNLTGEQQTDVTDAVAAALDDLNPNHTYPPTTK